MNARQRVKNYLAKHGVQNPERIRKALYNGTGGPVPTSIIREILAQVSGPNEPSAPSPNKKPGAGSREHGGQKIKTRSLSEFRSQHDYALKLKRAIADLGEGYVTEHEMKLASSIPSHVWRRYADLPEFQPNKLKLREVTYWAKARVGCFQRQTPFMLTKGLSAMVGGWIMQFSPGEGCSRQTATFFPFY